MFIGHLPAGYLASRKVKNTQMQIAFMLGSVAPDLDMLLFYFRDARSVHHHEYLTHRPALWLGILIVALCFRRFTIGETAGWFAAGGLLHMVLDTTLGAINWGWPLFSFGGPFIIVPATQSHWVLSFIFHWTFLLEIAICACALWVFLKRRQT